MNVGFYYHTGTVLDEGQRVAVPSYLGVFIEELARQAGRVTFCGHSGSPSPTEDRVLGPPLVHPIDLGPRRGFPARTFWPRPALRRFSVARDAVDVMLIRGPTPLLPHLARRAACPVVLLLVGDYEGTAPRADYPLWRRMAIAAWKRLYARHQDLEARHALVLANSPSLARVAGQRWPSVREIFTSSLTERDLREIPQAVRRWNEHKGTADPVRVLFAGRIAEEKGLVEAVDAVALLKQRGYSALLELAGWSDPPAFADVLSEHARRRGVGDRIVLHGYRPAGADLLSLYCEADIFIMPSRARRDGDGGMITFEGFPRAVTEALAVGLPVVASRVGGLAERLNDSMAVLVQPNSSDDLADGIERLVKDSQLRESLSRTGRQWARSFTNEQSCSLIVDAVREWMDQSKASAEEG